MSKTVITFGTFDVFHVGHLRVIERAAALGDRLVVGVSADALNERKKGRSPVFSQHERLEIVAALKAVDAVFLEESLEQKRDYIVEHKADVLVMGDDWAGKFDEFQDICEVHYLTRTPAISTTALIEKISNAAACTSAQPPRPQFATISGGRGYDGGDHAHRDGGGHRPEAHHVPGQQDQHDADAHQPEVHPLARRRRLAQLLQRARSATRPAALPRPGRRPDAVRPSARKPCPCAAPAARRRLCSAPSSAQAVAATDALARLRASAVSGWAMLSRDCPSALTPRKVSTMPPPIISTAPMK